MSLRSFLDLNHAQRLERKTLARIEALKPTLAEKEALESECVALVGRRDALRADLERLGRAHDALLSAMTQSRRGLHDASRALHDHADALARAVAVQL